MDPARGRGRAAGRPGTLFPGRAGRRDLRPGPRRDDFRRVGHPRVLAARPAAGVAGDAAPAGVAERGRGADVLGAQPRGAARAAVRRRLVRRAGEVDPRAGGLGHAALRAAARGPSAGAGDDDAEGDAAAAGHPRGGGQRGDAGADVGEPDAPGGELSRGGDADLRRHAAGAAGARRRAGARPRRRAVDLGDAGGGAGAAGGAGARPGGGRGRSAGVGRRGRGRVRHRGRGGFAAGAAAGLGRRGDRGRQRAGRDAAGLGRAGGGALSTRTGPTGWWPR